MEKFTTGEPFSFSWQKVKTHLSYVVLCALGVLFVTGVFNLPVGETIDSGGEAILSIAGYVVSIFVQYGIIRLALKLLNDERGGVQDFLPSWKTFWHLVFGGLLYSLIVFFGILLLIFPGFIWGLRYSQVFYLIVDRDMGPVEALKESARMTYGYKKKMLGIFIISLGIAVLGLLALVVGLLVALPLVTLSWAYVYRKLSAPVPVVQSDPSVADKGEIIESNI